MGREKSERMGREGAMEGIGRTDRAEDRVSSSTPRTTLDPSEGASASLQEIEHGGRKRGRGEVGGGRTLDSL